ncbi:MAG: phosphatidate cytidylyltransferase [Rickettsiales bacterium]|nr:phosphatidate cytidylyltransferase [Rickettsiales bacterium]
MAENNKKNSGAKKVNDVEIVVDDIKEKSQNIFDKILNLLPDYLKDRVVPAIILGILAVIVLYSSIIIFNLCMLAVAILMAFEWITIARSEDETNKWRFIGLGYIILPCISLIFIRGMANGSDIILWLFLVVWTTDTAAMIVGMTFGGPKLAPTISPKKTWSGLAGGVVASMFIGLLCSVLFKENALFFIILSGFMAVLEQIGDLIESKFKRYFNVKDSGNLIPGHGGVMDRVDGLTVVAPFVALLVILSKSIF